MNFKNIFLLLAISCSVSFSQAQTQPGYLMHPDVNAEQIVFVSEGDIWKVPISGGQAIRLTSHPGDESDPKLSPDGKWVAYAASYEGPTEVYMMPMAGGLPKRLTYEPAASIPIDWKSATEIGYVTNQYATLPKLMTLTINMETGAKSFLPLEMAAEGSFSEDGQTYFFVRPTFHNNVTKRYEGGTARQIWKYTSGVAEAVKLTQDYKGEDHHPVAHQGKVYFLSSRDGIVNVWVMDQTGGAMSQITKEPSFDVREFSLSGNQLVYRVGADLKIMSLGDNSAKTLAISLVSDFDQLREKWVDNPMDNLTGIAVSNDGERIALTTRGRVFSIPAKEGRTVRLSRKDGVRYRDAIFSPDGKSILTFSDESSEFEIHEYNSFGMDQGKQLSKNGNTLKFDMLPSPDGSKIAFLDLNMILWILDKNTGNQTKITVSDEDINGMSWSPDSKWIAFVQAATNTFSQIHAFNVDTKKRIAMTSDRANSLSPQWSPDGNWLYFLSDRNFQSVISSPWGQRQPEPFWEKQMKIYQIGLKKDLISPFFYSNELEIAKEKEKDKATEKVTVTIEEAGLLERLREVPIPAGNYTNLIVTDKALYFHEIGPGMGVFYGGGARGDEKAPLMMAMISNNPEPKAFIENVRSYSVSLNNKYILVRSGSTYSVVELGTSPVTDLSKTKVDFSSVKFSIDPREDWKQIFTDAWRMERDYFYDANMHGVDWDGMREKYFPLVDRVTTRAELSDVIGEMVGELSVLHTSVRGGDLRDGEDDISFGMLGAQLTRNEKLHGYTVTHIYQSDPDYPDEMSPLSHPDVNIAEGDIITHIDGVSVMEVPDIYALLRDKAGKQIRVSLLTAEGKAKTDRILKPISSRAEANLRYNEWEWTRRMEVDEKSGGDMGYVHLRAMTETDIHQWYRDFYPQFKKKGLVIDVRQNRGGNIDSFILEKLMREVFFYWKGRTGESYWNMPYAFRGHLVLLVDEFTASDGEAFAEGFRRLGMGKAIGARTWGGEVWLSGSNTLSDNGIARAPMNGVYGENLGGADNDQGVEWLIEGVGFIPDIEVINLPKASFDGSDAQLDAAIEHLKELIKGDPRPVPQPPAYPDKSFKKGNN